MADSYELNAEPRSDVGKGASRRLRHADKVPAVIYGGGKDPANLLLEHNEVLHALENEGFYSHILDINIAGDKEQAVLKDVQRHPAKARIMHLDFQRIDKNAKLHMHIPLHFIGEDVAPGVKAGGLVTHSITEVEIRCLPKDLPEYLEVDISGLELDAIVHMSDIKIPEGVELVELSHGEGHDQPVASVHMPRVVKEEEEVPAEGEEAAPAEEAKAEGGEESES
jgi:large subunit ribosomal protein L25